MTNLHPNDKLAAMDWALGLGASHVLAATHPRRTARLHRAAPAQSAPEAARPRGRDRLGSDRSCRVSEALFSFDAALIPAQTHDEFSQPGKPANFLIAKRSSELLKRQHNVGMQSPGDLKQLIRRMQVHFSTLCEGRILQVQKYLDVHPADVLHFARNPHRFGKRLCTDTELVQSCATDFQRLRLLQRSRRLIALPERLHYREITLPFQAFAKPKQVGLPITHRLDELKPQPHGSRLLVMLSAPRFQNGNTNRNTYGEERSNCRPRVPVDNAVLAQNPALAGALQHAHSSIPLSPEAILP